MSEEERLVAVAVPHLAESLVSATMGKWLKQPGEYVLEYEILCELETDKVNTEMPSPTEGTLVRILAEEGAVVAVGETICLLREPETNAEPEKPPEAALPGERFSPAVLRLAEEHGIDLRRIKGTALGGRISRKDVLAYLAKGEGAGRSEPAPAPAPALSEAAPIKPAAFDAPPAPMEQVARARKEVDVVPATALRRTIAARTLRSVTEIPHAWMSVEADVTGLVALREALKISFERKEGAKLTVTPFAIKAVVSALKDFPMLNASWTEEGISTKKEIHLSVAVGTEEAVLTPVIRNADRLTIAGLALELDDLATRARAGKLHISDMQDGTFTFNNTGAFGSVLSYPIINYPQAAIATFETIVRKPVVIGRDMIAIRATANVCLSLDHRVLDGYVCGKFLQKVKRLLESYGPDTAIY